jgi:hypothetical protein
VAQLIQLLLKRLILYLQIVVFFVNTIHNISVIIVIGIFILTVKIFELILQLLASTFLLLKLILQMLIFLKS